MKSETDINYILKLSPHPAWSASVVPHIARRQKKTVRCLLLCVCAMPLFAASVRADVVHLAVASNFAKPIQALVADFEETHPHQAQVSLGSTGKLFAQIQHGAPFDVLMAADQQRPALLEQQGRVVPDSRSTYATGRLVLWSADPQRFGSATAAGHWPSDAGVLIGSERAAIANPKLAPYGAAAQQVLQRAGA